MSNTNDNGGPAFPCPQDAINQDTPSLGMTLRDYFAAKVIQGICTTERYMDLTNDEIAEEAYAVADAMLKARSK